MPHDHCSNCQQTLTGPYCARCGQHSHDSAQPLKEVLHDAWHTFTHVDGSLWRTLRLLVTRPGLLTQEYFAGRRARYSPPFRLYFVVSLVFFGISTLTNHIDTGGDDPTGPTHVRQGPVVMQLGLTPQQAKDRDEDGSLPSLTELQTDCGRINTHHPRLDVHLKEICRHQLADRGQSLLREFGHLLPRMMFVFLPLMAAVMLLAYRKRRHFYLEHLVFLMHTQSAVYLALLAIALVAVGSEVLPESVQALVMPFVAPALTAYYLWYIFAALRRFYGESRGRTFAKYCALGAAYLVLVVFLTSLTFVVSAVLT